ncbi:DUF92 domain-containing protein [Priestia filamentosa]|uniref:DUF92 domain-containing protein n=1 Tax=Priestia filamentosa TaxID=1402861 RepID=UPI001FB37DDC|nr:DUF92 domain-containing protein [Priestia filamentosa]MED3725328.1 DUF92 domain-containing protein [Priestia filamentosa]UOE61422.1 DUF92 domain-containing protein [Priestia filamentosa]
MNEHLLFFLLIIVASYAGYKVKALTKSGAFGAFLIGSSIYAGTGVKGLALLGVFFITSSCVSFLFQKRKEHVEEKLEKSSSRDIIQVFANGGVPALFSLFLLFDPTHKGMLTFLFAVSIAAANSDTWASEIGTLSKRKPRYILTLRKVEAGTSGAISLLGTFAAFSGALLIGLFFTIFWKEKLIALLFIAIFGFLGNIADTVLGATIQVEYKCTNCGIHTEKTEHCYMKTKKIKGIIFFNNDTVNVTAVFIGAFLAFLAFPYIQV